MSLGDFSLGGLTCSLGGGTGGPLQETSTSWIDRVLAKVPLAAREEDTAGGVTAARGHCGAGGGGCAG
jgi:hypothetical protein